MWIRNSFFWCVLRAVSSVCLIVCTDTSCLQSWISMYVFMMTFRLSELLFLHDTKCPDTLAQITDPIWLLFESMLSKNCFFPVVTYVTHLTQPQWKRKYCCRDCSLTETSVGKCHLCRLSKFLCCRPLLQKTGVQITQPLGWHRTSSAPTPRMDIPRRRLCATSIDFTSETLAFVQSDLKWETRSGHHAMKSCQSLKADWLNK